MFSDCCQKRCWLVCFSCECCMRVHVDGVLLQNILAQCFPTLAIKAHCPALFFFKRYFPTSADLISTDFAELQSPELIVKAGKHWKHAGQCALRARLGKYCFCWLNCVEYESWTDGISGTYWNQLLAAERIKPVQIPKESHLVFRMLHQGAVSVP